MILLPCRIFFVVSLDLTLPLLNCEYELCAAGAIDRADHAYSWPTPGGMGCTEVMVRRATSIALCAAPALICSLRGLPLARRLSKGTETIKAQACLNWLAIFTDN